MASHSVVLCMKTVSRLPSEKLDSSTHARARARTDTRARARNGLQGFGAIRRLLGLVEERVALATEVERGLEIRIAEKLRELRRRNDAAGS